RTADDEDAPRIRRRDFDADAPEVFAFREAVGELAPRRAAVGRFEQTIALAVEVSVLPRSLARFPQDGVDRLRIGGVDRDVEGADVLILVKYFFERSASVGRAEDAALRIRSVRMPERCDEQAIGIRTIDGDHRD